MPLYSVRVELAFKTALEAHGLRRRKAGGFEIAHVTAVALIAADHGCEEDIVVAALLHDTLEDTTLPAAVIETRFGPQVREMVQDVTEPSRRAPWRARKQQYIDRLRTTPRLGSLVVASADKIHNLSTMVAGLDTDGPAFLDRFTPGPDDLLWYQQTVFTMLSGRWDHPILAAHRDQLEQFTTRVTTSGARS